MLTPRRSMRWDRFVELLEAIGRGDEFAAYVADVRVEEHKRKRNLLKLLDAVTVG